MARTGSVPLHWAGAALSLTGIYIVVGHGMSVGAGSLRGDLLMAVAVCCWAIYTLGSRPLMTRHSPVGVTGLSMAIGTLIYVPAAWPHIRAVDWIAVSRGTWIAIVYSALFALCVAVHDLVCRRARDRQRADVGLFEPRADRGDAERPCCSSASRSGVRKLAGAAAVLAGVALTRVGGGRMAVPACE